MRIPISPGPVGLVLALLLSGPARGDQLRYATPADWSSWSIPTGIVRVAADGSIRPVEVRKNNNAALDAVALGGGVHAAGSNPAQAAWIFDGDPTTGWAPDSSDVAGDWYVELDLGRAVSAHSVTLQFDESAAPFELFDLLLSTGEQKLDVVGNPIENTLNYRISERYKANDRHRITFTLDEPLHTPIRYVRVQPLTFVPGARLTEVEVTAFGDNLLTNLLEKGGNIEIVTAVELGASAVALGNAASLIDGDLVTRYSQRNEPRAAFDIFGHVTLDLGAVFYADLMRIIGGVVVRSGGGGGITTAQLISRRNYIYRFYEVLTSDGSLSPDGTRVWTKHFSDYATEDMRRRGMADHSFDPIPTRYVRFRWRVWDAECAFGAETSSQAFTAQNCLVTGWTEELQVFGQGYPREVAMRSPLIDLEEGKNLDAIHWEAETPPGTRVEIRTRTGNEVEFVQTFRDKNGKEVTERAWGRLIPSFRGPIDTTLVAGGDWSPWSTIYGAPGDLFQSPSPRRFLEIDARLVSEDPTTAPTLRSVAIDVSPPLAGRTLGEILPSDVEPGRRTRFSYFLRAEQSPDGFDGLQLEASTQLEFLEVLVDGAAVEATATETEKGLAVTLPRKVHDELVELRFATSVYVQSTRFDVYLTDADRGPAVRQRVDAGDASDLAGSNSTVVSIPVRSGLLSDLEVTPEVLSANGDGVNDEMQVRVNLLNVLGPRPLRLRVYDLSGRLWLDRAQQVSAGQQVLRWDGRADGGLVPPGVYVVDVSLEGDAGEVSRRHLLPVVY